MLKTAVMFILLPVLCWYCFTKRQDMLYLKTSWEFPPPSDTFMRFEYVVHLWGEKEKWTQGQPVWCGVLFPNHLARSKTLPYFWFLWRIFFSLWLFVELVFLETRQTTWSLLTMHYALNIVFFIFTITLWKLWSTYIGMAGSSSSKWQ